VTPDPDLYAPHLLKMQVDINPLLKASSYKTCGSNKPMGLIEQKCTAVHNSGHGDKKYKYIKLTWRSFQDTSTQWKELIKS
jgi:hypothetical protein